MGFKNWIIQKVIEREANKMLEKMDGKKTYLVMAAVVIFGAIDAWNEHCGFAGCKLIEVPKWIYPILGTLGVYTRSVAKPK